MLKMRGEALITPSVPQWHDISSISFSVPQLLVVATFQHKVIKEIKFWIFTFENDAEQRPKAQMCTDVTMVV